MWRPGDPFTDGSYVAAAGGDPQVFWDAVHGNYAGTALGRDILDWWRDKPHQVLAEVCEGWRQARARLEAEAAAHAATRHRLACRERELERVRTTLYRDRVEAWQAVIADGAGKEG